MTRFRIALIAASLVLLSWAGEASAQRIRVGVGAGYGGYGYPGYGYGGYRPWGYGYGYGGPGVSVGFQSGRYGAVVGSGGYGYPGYGNPGYGYSYPTWPGGYGQPWTAGSIPSGGYVAGPTYPPVGIVTAGGVPGSETGIMQVSSSSLVAAPAKLDITVPADAEVWFDGTKSTDTGPQRKFVSKELQPGVQDTFTMKIRWNRDGEERTQEFTVPIHAGEDARMDARPLLD
jgi:uncharacterized protein (TIGR03000 family)